MTSSESEAQGSETRRENITPVRISKEMKSSYLDYAMSVIVSRALPDARDGLKPVQRRILYAMYKMGLHHNKPYRKSARIVGDVMGNYHPHGDQAIYNTLVRMAQPFSFNIPLVDGQGNFGSIDGDPPAAMRYTEARLSRFAEELLEDIDKDTVEWRPNYDNTAQEPVVLPCKAPNLLVNGSSGIAVGMATNIPPHNLGEVVDALVLLIDNPDAPEEEVFSIIRGPDFPTGGEIHGKSGIIRAYKTGRGKIVVRGVVEVEEDKNGQRLVITEIPYAVNKTDIVREIASMVNSKRIEGVRDIRDESSKEGIRVVIELQKGANPEIVRNQLFKHSRLQTTMGIINLALVDGAPKTLSLVEMLQVFLEHRKTVVVRRTKWELKRAEERAHILEGLLVALEHIDEVIELIKKSRDREEARHRLMENYELTETQANAILAMQLQRLTGLERESIKREHEELLEKIKDLKDILEREERVREIIKNELLEIKDKYATPRKTRILESEESVDLDIEDLIPDERVAVVVTARGYVKRMPLEEYRQQKRGGKGIKAVETTGDDHVARVFVTTTHKYVLCFTNRNRVYWLKVYQIPESGRYSRGRAIVNLLPLEEGEKVTAILPVEEFDPEMFVFMATKKGRVKKTPLSAFSRPRKDGIIAISLGDGDELVGVGLTSGSDEILLATRKGMAIRFGEDRVRPMGRQAAGVRGIRLGENDEVVSLVILHPGESDKTLLTITTRGYGKRTRPADYRKTGRGGKGITSIKLSRNAGDCVGVLPVRKEDEVMVTSSFGKAIRIPVSGVPVLGRHARGVRIMRLEEGDSVASFTVIEGEEE